MFDHQTLDRVVSYKGIDYKIVEILSSNHLLVIPKDSDYPVIPVIIPGE